MEILLKNMRRSSMKISDNLYHCPWCDNQQEDYPKVKNSTWHGQIICNKCGRHISQK